MNDIITVSDLRVSKGWSQRRLAREAGVSPKAVWCLENHVGKSELLTLGRIAKALGQDLETLKAIVENSKSPGGSSKPAGRTISYRSLGDALGQLDDDYAKLPNEPELIMLVPMTVQEVDSLRQRLSYNEQDLDKVKKSLGL